MCWCETNPLFAVLCSAVQVSADAGVDTLIPLSLQGKDNPILQQLLPTLLNPAVLGEFVLVLLLNQLTAATMTVSSVCKLCSQSGAILY